MLASGHSERIIEDVYPRYEALWLLEETVETARALARHVGQPDAFGAGLILSLN